MPLPFDATLKDLAQVSPRGLLAAFDEAPALPVSLLTIDLSTVTTAADLVFGLGQPLQEIIHLDFQSSALATKHFDVLIYNALLHRRYRVPVHSIVVLLRPQAAHANLNGVVTYAPRPGKGKMDYQYELIPLWERPVTELLAGDVGALPLAMLGQLPAGVDLETGLADVAERVMERLQREAPAEQVRRLLTAAFVLTGLRVPRQVARELFQGVRAMRDSDTYMAILDEGREEGIEIGRIDEVKKLILRFGQKSLGVPEEGITTALAALTDLERLERLLERVGEVKSWQELLSGS
jgi:predicted transposase YdaD